MLSTDASFSQKQIEIPGYVLPALVVTEHTNATTSHVFRPGLVCTEDTEDVGLPGNEIDGRKA